MIDFYYELPIKNTLTPDTFENERQMMYQVFPNGIVPNHIDVPFVDITVSDSLTQTSISDLLSKVPSTSVSATVTTQTVPQVASRLPIRISPELQMQHTITPIVQTNSQTNTSAQETTPESRITTEYVTI